MQEHSSTPTLKEAPASPESSRRLRARARTAAFGATALVVLVQVWIISAGWMTAWPSYSSYDAMLADAFLHGRTSLRIEPSPALLALPDPYDPVQNAGMRIHDASLFHGKYYLYWGPVPALLLAPIQFICGDAIGDEYVLFGFVFALTVLTAYVLLRLRTRYFAGAPPWTVAMGILVGGLATPIPFLLARASVYEAAIVAGQFFLIAGIYLAFTALVSGAVRPIRLAAAGSCWALAVGSRPSLSVAVGVLAILCASKIWRTSDLVRRRGIALTALAAPLLLGAVLLGTYNFVRFGSWHEFGQRYQLAAFDLRHVENHLFSVANVPVGFYASLLKPLKVIDIFPFVKAEAGPGTYPLFVPMPLDYEALEPTAGLVWCSPFLLLAIVPLILQVRRFLRVRSRAERNMPEPIRAESNELANWLLLAALLGLAPVLFLIGSTMRYLADLSPPLVILATLGLWRWIQDQPTIRRRLLVLAATLAIYSVAVGVLLGLTGYYRHFHTFHPGYLGL